MVTPAQIIQAFGTALNQALDIIQELLTADTKDKSAISDGLAKIDALNAQLKTATMQLASTQISDSDLTIENFLYPNYLKIVYLLPPRGKMR